MKEQSDGDKRKAKGRLIWWFAAAVLFLLILAILWMIAHPLFFAKPLIHKSKRLTDTKREIELRLEISELRNVLLLSLQNCPEYPCRIPGNSDMAKTPYADNSKNRVAGGFVFPGQEDRRSFSQTFIEGKDQSPSVESKIYQYKRWSVDKSGSSPAEVEGGYNDSYSDDNGRQGDIAEIDSIRDDSGYPVNGLKGSLPELPLLQPDGNKKFEGGGAGEGLPSGGGTGGLPSQGSGLLSGSGNSSGGDDGNGELSGSGSPSGSGSGSGGGDGNGEPAGGDTGGFSPSGSGSPSDSGNGSGGGDGNGQPPGAGTGDLPSPGSSSPAGSSSGSVGGNGQLPGGGSGSGNGGADAVIFANTVFVLDSSGSMAIPFSMSAMEAAHLIEGHDARQSAALQKMQQLIDNEPPDSRLNVAKTLLQNLIPRVEQRYLVGLVRFGGDCGRVETFVAPPSTSRNIVLDAIRSTKPKGTTPLANSIRAASRLLRVAPAGPARIVVLSDGRDTCKGDPCREARSIREIEVRPITINIVSLGISQMKQDSYFCVAKETGGKSFQANTQQEFEEKVLQAAGLTLGAQ